MLLSLTGNHEISKRQIAPQKALNEGSGPGISHSIIILDGLYIDRKAVNEVRGSAPIAENRTQNVKQLVIQDFNEKYDEYYRELSQDIDINDKETVDPLIREYN